MYNIDTGQVAKWYTPVVVRRRRTLRGRRAIAPVAELVDAHGLGPCLERGRGSNPLGGTKILSKRKPHQSGTDWRGARSDKNFHGAHPARQRA